MHLSSFVSPFRWELCERCLYIFLHTHKHRHTFYYKYQETTNMIVYSAGTHTHTLLFWWVDVVVFLFLFMFLCFQHINFASLLSNESFSLPLSFFLFVFFSFFKFVSLYQCLLPLPPPLLLINNISKEIVLKAVSWWFTGLYPIECVVCNICVSALNLCVCTK